VKNSLFFVILIFSFSAHSSNNVALKNGIQSRYLNTEFKISDVQKWIGKYPFYKIKGADIFSIKAVDDDLQQILGLSKYQEFFSIEEIGVHTPVELSDGIIHFTVCQKHKCGHTFYFLLEVKSSRLFVCERELDIDPSKSPNNDSSDWRVTWFSEKGKQVLPGGYCESYDEIQEAVNWKKTFESIPRNI